MKIFLLKWKKKFFQAAFINIWSTFTIFNLKKSEHKILVSYIYRNISFYYICSGEDNTNGYLFSTIFFKATNELRNFALTTHNECFYLQLWIWFVLGAARLVVFRLVGCLRRKGLARCWDASVLLDVGGKYSKSPCSFVCRERSDARIDRVNFWGDKKWCLWKACWMFLIYVQLGFLVKNP